MFNPLERTFKLVHGRTMKAFKGIPGPTPYVPFGTGLDFARRDKMPWEICADYGRKYGGMTLIWFGGKPALVLNDPKLIRQVLVDDWQSYYKDAPRKALLPIISRNSAFLASPPSWTSLRESEPFAMKGFEEWLPTQIAPMRDVITANLEKWIAAPYAIDLLDDIQRVTFDAFTVSTCGVKLGDGAYDDFMAMAQVGTKRMTSMLPIPREPQGLSFAPVHERWYARFEALVKQAKQNPDKNRQDLLAVLLRSGVKMEGTVLRDGIANITFGGVFSVTSALVSAFYLLANNRIVLNKLVEELRQLSQAKTKKDDALLNCKYLDSVLRETLRYYCPVPLYFRNVLKKKPATLGGHTIPPNTPIWITPWLIHRSEEHWKNPDAFQPSRWEEEGAEKDTIGSDWFFPFGRGPRMCVSVPFSMMYMKLVLATVLTQSRVEMIPDEPYKQEFFFGVMMPQGLEARFETI